MISVAGKIDNDCLAERIKEMAENRIFKEISLEGAEKIGEGAHGEVYRLDEETIAKVYRGSQPLEKISREKELSKWAFVKGIPTAISYDIVKAGDRYGVVYELLKARSAWEYVNESEENLEDFVKKSIELMKYIHSIEVRPGELPDMKLRTLEWIVKCREYMPDDICDWLKKLTEELPESHTFLHADFHIKNIMIVNGELMLIDMDTLCAGDPIFELASIYNSYKEFPSMSPGAAAFLGIDVDTATRLWDRTLELYTEDSGEAARLDTEKRAQIFGCIRIIDFFDRYRELPDREMGIETCVRDITKRFSASSC